jgi:hypothetical protein
VRLLIPPSRRQFYRHTLATWLVTLGVVIATAVVLLKNRQTERFGIVAASTALLFALPSLRSATPGIPDTPTVSDGE